MPDVEAVSSSPTCGVPLIVRRARRRRVSLRLRTPHRRRDPLRQRTPVRGADRPRLFARTPRVNPHRQVVVRARLDLEIPDDLSGIPAARGLAAHGAHRGHFAALDLHAVLAHGLRALVDCLAERHPHLDPLLAAVVLGRRRHEPRRQRYRRGRAIQPCTRRPSAPSVGAKTTANPDTQRAGAVDADGSGQLGILRIVVGVLYRVTLATGSILGRHLGLPLVDYLVGAGVARDALHRRKPGGPERLGAGASDL